MSFARARTNRTNVGGTIVNNFSSLNTPTNTERDKDTKCRSLSQPPNNRDTSNSEKIGRDNDLCRTLSSVSIRTPHETMSTVTDQLDSTETKSNQGDSCKKPTTEASSRNALTKKSSGIPLPLKSSAPIKNSSPMSKSNASRSTAKSSTSTSLSSKDQNVTKRNLEIQFANKKRKLELMKKELKEKQRTAMEMYESLVTMKKSLEDNGKAITLGPLKLIEFDEKNKREQLAGAGEIGKKSSIDPNVINDMKLTMKQIPLSLMDVCKNIMSKRAAIISLLESDNLADKETVLKRIDLLKKESCIIEKTVEDTFALQEQQVAQFFENWQKLFNSGETEEKLRKDMAKQEKTLMEITADLQKAQMQLKESNDHNQKQLSKAQEEVIALHDKIFKLENELMMEKLRAQKEKSSVNYESKYKTLQKQFKDVEMGKAKLEKENEELQTKIRAMEHKIRIIEQKTQKEKEEMEKRKKQDMLVYTKLNQEKQLVESRLAATEETMEQKEKEYNEHVAKLLKECEDCRRNMIKANEDKDVMKSKYDGIQKELIKMQMINKQAIDVVGNRKQLEGTTKEKLTTEMEAQLYTELLATKLALKASQDKLEQYAKEKLRFIDSIEQLNGGADKSRQGIAKALLIKEEEINRLINEKNQYEDSITKQKLEISSLQMSVSNLEERIRALQVEAQKETDQELKKSLQEGRLKLEQALKRSLENEQRLLKFEHDIGQKTKQLNDMENLLKVRDGLIGMMKTKKDELTQENESLNQYAEQVRALLIQSRDESNQKNNLISDLQSSLDLRLKQMQKMEQRVRELEDALSITNEKRYKLQDTIGTMEKELQSTKAHINQMADMQTRYAPTGMLNNYNSNALEDFDRRERKLQIDSRNPLMNDGDYMNVRRSNTDRLHEINVKSSYLNTNRTLSSLMENFKANNNYNINNPNKFTSSSTFVHSLTKLYEKPPPVNVEKVPPNAASYNISVTSTMEREIAKNYMPLLNAASNYHLGRNETYTPLLMNGIERYHVHREGALMWCKPNQDMLCNNSLITQDIIAQSCKEIRRNIDESLKIIEEHHQRQMHLHNPY